MSIFSVEYMIKPIAINIFFYYGWYNLFMDSGYKFLVKYMYCEYFLPACDLPFHVLNDAFWRIEVFSFHKA